jgi:membrane-bound acyltransferase YfiQ involved in biofilm formation
MVLPIRSNHRSIGQSQVAGSPSHHWSAPFTSLGLFSHYFRYGPSDYSTTLMWPSHWFFYFAFGGVIGSYPQQTKAYLMRYRRLLLIALPVTAMLHLIESDLEFRSVHTTWFAYTETITFTLYAMTFIFCFLAYEEVKLPFANAISQIGGKSFGIYLLHFTIIEITARLIYRFAPVMVAYRAVLVLIFVVVGLAGPLVIMAGLLKSPMRQSYHYLFG